MQGVFRYTSEVGDGDERVEYERINTYNGQLLKTELIERGNVNTPSGKVFKERTRTVTEFKHHPMCREAVVQETTRTHVAPDSNDAGSATEVEEGYAMWRALGGNEMYLASESIKDTLYHASGYLKSETETIRELDVLRLEGGDRVFLDRVYNTRTRTVLNEPNAGGRWVQYTTERQTENIVVYEASEPNENGVSEAVAIRVQRTSRATSRAEPSDAAPAQLNCSPPEPEDPDPLPETAPCLEKQEHAYQKALQAWAAKEALKTAEYESRAANIGNQPKRVHSVGFGIPRLDIELNSLYGGALAASVSHSYTDDGSQVGATSSLTVWQRRS